MSAWGRTGRTRSDSLRLILSQESSLTPFAVSWTLRFSDVLPSWGRVHRCLAQSFKNLKSGDEMRKETALLRYASVLALILTAGGCHKRPPVAPLPPIEAPAPAPPTAPTCALTAEPASVEPGKSVTLSWTSQNGTDFDLQPGLGKQQAQGSTSVAPRDSTTYTLAVTGPGGNGTCIARVTVSAPPPAPPPGVKEENLESLEEL